jgi:hypothetical protein
VPKKDKPETEMTIDSKELNHGKNGLTAKELTFMEILFTGEVKPEKAVELAGYKGYSQRQRYRIAAKIVKKYEALGEGARKIFRDIKFGELTVAEGIKRLAQKGKSEIVRLRAHELAARALGMLEQKEQGSEGITVIIQALDGGQQQVNLTPPGQPALPDPGSYRHPQPSRPGQPITITK